MARVHHVGQVPHVERESSVGSSSGILARLIGLAGFIIFALLAFRFILSLFGANRGNGFADFIYDTSHPLVTPFFGLFNYTPQFGISRFEFETLIAMIFYAIVIGIAARLVNLGGRD